MIKRTVGDGIGAIQNHQDIIKIKIDVQIVIHLKIEVIVMMAEVIVVAAVVVDDEIMNTTEKIDGIHIEAVIPLRNIVIIRNLNEIICHIYKNHQR